MVTYSLIKQSPLTRRIELHCIKKSYLMKQKLILILALTTVLAGCHRAQETGHAHDHDHDHGEVKLVFTAYSDHFEVFAEADPFAAGYPSAILVHLTTLSDFKPLAEGRVTISLITGNTGIRQTVDTPERLGVYTFSLRPESTGTAKLLVTIAALGHEETFDLGMATIYADAHEAIHEEELLMKEIPGAISFGKEQSWRIDFATDLVRQELFGPVVKTTGVVLPSHADETTLHAGTRGMISFAGNRLYEGTSTGKGSHLMTIASAALADDNATIRYQEARNNYEKSKADYERISRLHKEQIMSERELLEASNTFRNAEILYENISKHFSDKGQLVSSPYDGFIRELYVSEGQFVETGQALARIARNREMLIKADVQPRYADMLHQIAEVSLGMSGRQVLTLQEMGGAVISIGQAVNPQTNMVPVTLMLPARTQIMPGSLLDVYIRTQSDIPGLVVPNAALVEEQENYFVFVQIHPESFLKQQVHIGHTDGLYTKIYRGLSAGDRIVTRGAIMVKLAAAAGDLDPHAGHIH